MIINESGGGAGLNLKVVGGTTQPTNPKENTVWVNTNIDIHSYAFSATQPHRVSKNKNLIVYPFYYTTQTISGVTWTDNGDGTLKVNGTASASTDSIFRCSHIGVNNHEMLLAPGTYRLSGCPAGGSSAKYVLMMAYSYDDWATTLLVRDYGSGVTFTLTAEAKARVTCSVIKATTVSNIVFKPQLEKGSTATSFVKGDATGMVWFQTGASSFVPINVDKKNTVMLYPLSCKQYVSGAWVQKTAKTYIDGAWKDWAVFLYNYGVTDLNITFTTDTFSNGSLGTDCIYMESTNKYNGTVSMSASPAINLTPYRTAKIEIENTGSLATMTVGFGTTEGSYSAANWTYQGALTKQTVTIDITSLDGEYYLAATRATNASSNGVGITKIYSISLE